MKYSTLNKKDCGRPFGQIFTNRASLGTISPQLSVLGHSLDGWAIYDRPNSHVHAAPELLLKLLPRLTLGGRPFVNATVDFGILVGDTDCVVTEPGDLIVYARRPGRWGFTRFVKDRKSEPTTSGTAVLKFKSDQPQGYILITAFAGTRAFPEPWDRNAEEGSVPFWTTHALVWGSCPVEHGTETSICPWPAPSAPHS